MNQTQTPPTPEEAVKLLREALQKLIDTPWCYGSGQEYWAECQRKKDYARANDAISATATLSTAAPQPSGAVPDGDAGNAEADRIINRLMSADPDFNDCTDAADMIRKLVSESKGPDGFATWRDAAIAERLKRVAAAQGAVGTEAVVLQWRSKEVHPQTVNFRQYSEWETCDQDKFNEICHYRDNGYPHYEVRKLGLIAAAPQPPASTVPSFQQRVQPWMMECFGAEIAADAIERNHRFLEEALELVQACDCTKDEAHQLVDYVFGRPVGEKAQEVGGVMVTLAALCLAQCLDMHADGETELARIWTKVEAIRAKQAAKPKHSPLPVSTPSASRIEDDAEWQAVGDALRLTARVPVGATWTLACEAIILAALKIIDSRPVAASAKDAEDAKRYQWLLDNYAIGDGYSAIDSALNYGEPDRLSSAIDAAIATTKAAK